MYKLLTIKSSNINKIDKNKFLQIKTFINLMNKYWNHKDTFENLIKRLNRRKYTVYFILLFDDNKVVGGFRYYKTHIKDKILLNRFLYKNGYYYCIQEVFVIDEYRGKGILDKLFTIFFTKISKKAHGILAVEKSNKFAIKAYERNKFKKVIERKVTNKLLDSNTYSENFIEYLMIR